jgi:hypothetical protein
VRGKGQHDLVLRNINELSGNSNIFMPGFAISTEPRSYI